MDDICRHLTGCVYWAPQGKRRKQEVRIMTFFAVLFWYIIHYTAVFTLLDLMKMSSCFMRYLKKSKTYN